MITDDEIQDASEHFIQYSTPEAQRVSRVGWIYGASWARKKMQGQLDSLLLEMVEIARTVFSGSPEEAIAELKKRHGWE
jgi:hypothetical protein